MHIYNLILPFLILILIVICNLIFLNFKVLKKSFNKIHKKTWLILVIIFFLGLFLRMFVVSHMHNLYYDESGYLDVAKHIAAEGNNCLCLYNVEGVCKFCGYSFKSVGFTFLIALFFKIFGTSADLAFNVVAVIGSLTVILMFFFLYALFKKEKLALLGALILALYPLHLRWSGSASAEIFSLFFILLTFLFLILYFRTERLTLLLTSILLLCFTMTVREENVLLGLFFLAPFLIKKIHRKRVLIVVFFFACIVLPYFFGSFLFHTESGAENYTLRYTFWKQGKVLSYDFFKDTFFGNLSFFWNGHYTFSIIIFFNILGIIFMFKKNWRLSLMLFFWLLAVPSLFSAYVGQPLRYSEVRHYIPVLISIIIFSSYGIFYLCKNHFFEKIKLFYVITVIILVSIVFYVPYLTSEKSPVVTAQQDHDFMIQILDEIPHDCLIITQESYLFDFFDRSAVSIYLKDRGLDLKGLSLENDCLFYYKGELCYREELKEVCKKFEEKLDMELYLTNDRHKVYKIEGINE